MNFKITTLVENSVSIGGSRKLIGEQGLAFLIETGSHRILFDTGQYMALENNARVLGTELAGVDTVILSHGHYDHTGGLKHLLDCNSHFSLYAHPDVFARKLIKRKGQYREIGIPVSKNDLVKATGEKLETIIRYLQRFNLEKIVVGHCTGNHAIQALYTLFKDKVILNTVGNVITF